MITTEGWYTFEHRFNNTGVLSVTLTIKNSAGVPLHSWVLSDPSDIIGVTVGGNRYGALFNNEFDFLALDDSLKDGTEPEDNVDHFACYDVQEITRLPSRTVTLRDQFGPPSSESPLSVGVRAARTLCAPVDKNGEGTIFEDFHLVCYDLQTKNSPDVNVSVKNQFGEQQLRVKRRDVLCVPSTKEVIAN